MIKLKRIIASLLILGMTFSSLPVFAETDSIAAGTPPETSVVQAGETPIAPPASETVIPPSSSSVAPPASSSSTVSSESTASSSSTPASSSSAASSSSTASSETTIPSGSLPEDDISAPSSGTGLPQGELITEGGIDDLNADADALEVLNGNDEQLKAFLERLYKSCLGRGSDAKGISDWMNAIRHGMTGTDVAVNFFNSPEFIGLKLDDTEFLNRLYYVVFNRGIDEGGRKTWGDALANFGVSREWVLSMVLASDEFGAVCRSFGITQGSFRPTQPRDQNALLTQFVNRMYSVFLGRKGDEGGLNTWTNLFLKNQLTGANFAYTLTCSAEFRGRNLTDIQFINVAYNAAFGRDADNGGLATWLAALDDGMSHDYVLWGVINSAEFSAVCRKYNVVQGSYTPTQPRDLHPLQTEYTTALYSNLLGRRATEAELNDNVTKLSGGKTGAAMIQEIVTGNEFAVRGLSDSDCVHAFFLVLFGRDADANEMNTYTKYLLLNSRDALLNLLGGSNEFAAY
ncbi:MAG: DUF4214 domain-containing protein, partial [Ruthenibacterium sp.]